METQNLSPQLAQALNLEEARGALITRVLPGSGAAAAGLQPGDVVLAANGQRIANAAALHNIEGLQAVGSTLSLEIRRDGKPLSLRATLHEQLRQLDGAGLDPRLTGARFVELPEATRQAGLSGVLVSDVARGSRAEGSGLARGDVLLASSAGEFNDLAGLRASFDKRPPQLVLRILRGNRRGDLVMR